jgi:hypothetical protein
MGEQGGKGKLGGGFVDEGDGGWNFHGVKGAAD